MNWRLTLGTLSVGAMLGACAHSNVPATAASGPVEAAEKAASGAKAAVAVIEPRSGSTMKGVATFTEVNGKVALVVEVTDTPAGEHGIHIHEKGDCSASDAASAGSHWNPTKMDHGNPGQGAHHMGDMGNLVVGADGKGQLTFTSDDWSIGTGAENDVVGRALIIHDKVDDFSQPTGNAGSRIGCGVISKK